MGDAILITGATGHLGGLVAAEALVQSEAELVLPVRRAAAAERVTRRLAAELAARGKTIDPSRLTFTRLPGAGRISDLLPELRARGVRRIAHCAGCLSYYNVRRLEAGNVELTRELLALGAALDVHRFAFLSTAFSSGRIPEARIPERLHERPGEDPTEYTRTKREAEHLVAASGLPWLIARPSIVIGNSRDGRYGGKPYGLYQLWVAFERFLAGRFPRVIHMVAGRSPIAFVHQDAFSAGFWTAFEQLAPRSVIHLVSRDTDLPSQRSVIRYWAECWGGPEELHVFDSLDRIPKHEVDPGLELFLEFTAVNSEIAGSRWDFEHAQLDALRAGGLAFEDVTHDGLVTVQRRFIDDHPGLQNFLEEYRRRGVSPSRVVERDA